MPDVLVVQAVAHGVVGLVFAAVGILLLVRSHYSYLIKILASLTIVFAGAYRGQTTLYILGRSSPDTPDEYGFSSTVWSLILNANIIAFGSGLVAVLLYDAWLHWRDEKALEARTAAADLRDQTAGRRETKADARQGSADWREGAADHREGEADQRERDADKRERDE